MASSSGRQPNFAALNRGRHLCLAGRPSCWALAHILVLVLNTKQNKSCIFKLLSIRNTDGWMAGRGKDMKVSRPAWAQDPSFGLSLSLILLSLGLMKLLVLVSCLSVSWFPVDHRLSISYIKLLTHIRKNDTDTIWIWSMLCWDSYP